MPSTYTLIKGETLVSSAASYTFTAIPSTFTDLVVRMSTRPATGAGSFDTLAMRFNGSSATNYSVTYLIANDNTADSARSSSANRTFVRFGAGNGATANTFGSLEIYIPSYTASQSKPFGSVGVAENNATPAYIGANAGLFRDNTAISSILIYSENALNFAIGSSFYLYGIKNS
jgi:hypothetical protein